MANAFGEIFRVTTFGESHGGAVGVVIDGCPPAHKIDLEKVQAFLDRRRPGQSHLASPRNEKDRVECLSGLVDGITLGTPLTLIVRNEDMKKDHYDDLSGVYRPSHADYTTDLKYGVKAPTGGGRASARETIGRVAAAAVAEQILAKLVPDLRVVACVDRVKDVAATLDKKITRAEVDATPLRCPDSRVQKAMEDLIVAARDQGDSVGGSIACFIYNCPGGLGEPVFDKLEADLAKAMLSLPASKGFEVGSGFAGTYLYGSEHNDAFVVKDGKISTSSNRSGGIQGGISNGETISMRIGFKPVATIFKEQQTVGRDGKPLTMKPKAGRHDPCVLPRAVPMVEAMAILTVMDHYVRQRALTAVKGTERL